MKCVIHNNLNSLLLSDVRSRVNITLKEFPPIQRFFIISIVVKYKFKLQIGVIKVSVNARVCKGSLPFKFSTEMLYVHVFPTSSMWCMCYPSNHFLCVCPDTVWLIMQITRYFVFQFSWIFYYSCFLFGFTMLLCYTPGFTVFCE